MGIDGPHFVEHRTVENNAVILRRRVDTPTARVVPAQYNEVARAFRRVDLAEQAAIQVHVAPTIP